MEEPIAGGSTNDVLLPVGVPAAGTAPLPGRAFGGAA